jgi:hypothetical protein
MNNVWTTGYSGPIKISTFVRDEREIDIDDRDAQLTIQLELLETMPFALQAEDLVVTLQFDFSDPAKPDSITLGGKSTGPHELIKLSDAIILRSGETIDRFVTIRTGVFTETPLDRNTKSAKPGRKDIDVDLSYTLVPVNPAGTEKIEKELTLQLVVAED